MKTNKIKPIRHWHCFVVGSIHKAVTIPLADYKALLKELKELRKTVGHSNVNLVTDNR